MPPFVLSLAGIWGVAMLMAAVLTPADPTIGVIGWLAIGMLGTVAYWLGWRHGKRRKEISRVQQET
jgi:Sec-independent protein secretion pathway component TatC